MRIPGDPDGCAALARELSRAAFAVSEAGSLPERSLLPADFWRGAAAGRWEQLAGRRGVRAGRLAEQLTAAARGLGAFATTLADLQRRAGQLAAVAAMEGLAMDTNGSIPPVLVPMGPLTAPEALAEQRKAQFRVEVRDRLVQQVAVLRDEEDAAHRTLTGLLLAVGGLGIAEPQRARPSTSGDRGEDNPWAPELSDLTGLLGVFEKREAAPPQMPPPARTALGSLRTAPGLAVVGGVIGVGVDLADGRSLGSALTKQTVVTTASAAAGWSVGTALGLGAGGAAGAAGAGAVGAVAAAPLVPLAVGVGVVVGVSFGVGYVGSRLWDMAFPPQDEKRAPSRRGASLPKVGPASKQRLTLDPTCGQGPVLAQVS